MSTTMLKRDLGTGDLCDNIGLVGVSAKWSYVTASPSHHDQAIPILSPLLFMHVGHPYIPLFKIRRILIYLYIHSSKRFSIAIPMYGFACPRHLYMESQAIGCRLHAASYV